MKVDKCIQTYHTVYVEPGLFHMLASNECHMVFIDESENIQPGTLIHIYERDEDGLTLTGNKIVSLVKHVLKDNESSNRQFLVW